MEGGRVGGRGGSDTIRTQRPPEVLQKGNKGFLQSQCAVCISPPVVWRVQALPTAL
ncbi:hypothetical protein J6590_049227 [Homalodisca vitripennis]|nr:hypothetical protein J6590_049227 [Homalodisca vitripennis]